jgi:hypothetical protein
MNPKERAAMSIALEAMKRIEKEKLDIQHHNAGEFIEPEVWIAVDPDLCTIAMQPTFRQLIGFLGEGKTYEG